MQASRRKRRKNPSIENRRQLKDANAAFRKDFPDFRLPKLPIPPAAELESMLYTRLLFSCLVDADYTASAMNDDNAYLDHAEDSCFDPQILLEKLYAYCSDIRQASTADKTPNRYRDQVFKQCGNMGDAPEGLYTLTTPTGTGKTLALLHFALRHCLKHGKRRIIIVLPFLTLAEQNADTYSEIIPNVLVDHSQAIFRRTPGNWPPDGARRSSSPPPSAFSKPCSLTAQLSAESSTTSQTASSCLTKPRACPPA